MTTRDSQKRRLRQALEALTEIDRVIVLNRMAGRSNREIAELLFCSTERVKKRFQRATRRLRQLSSNPRAGSRTGRSPRARRSLTLAP